MQNSVKNKPALRRYTSLPAALHLLRNRQITMLSPESWDDRNDAFFMRQYKERKKFESVLALCFTRVSETYHHWRVFTHGSDGVQIEFERDLLLAAFAKIKGIRKGTVKYRRINVATSSGPSVDELPFWKRLPYKDEKEFRIIYNSSTEAIEAKGFDLSLNCIRSITLSPWLHESLVEAVRATIHSIDGCQNITVIQTSLLESGRWKDAALPPS